jgi:hypothetical protein
VHFVVVNEIELVLLIAGKSNTQRLKVTVERITLVPRKYLNVFDRKRQLVSASVISTLISPSEVLEHELPNRPKQEILGWPSSVPRDRQFSGVFRERVHKIIVRPQQSARTADPKSDTRFAVEFRESMENDESPSPPLKVKRTEKAGARSQRRFVHI